MKVSSAGFGDVTDENRFTEDGYYVWCGSQFIYRGSYYLAYSRWKREYGFEAWVTNSEIALAKSDSPMGPFTYVKTIRGKHAPGFWDSDCAHNPAILAADGRFYLYYMGNYGDGTYWNHRNHQRIGVGWADDPEGEWHFSDEPLIDVSEDGFDSLMTSNPTVTKLSDGRYYMIYKGVKNNGILPKGGAVVCGAAFAEDPLGPFEKVGSPIFVNPENDWSVEDPFVWEEDGRLHAIVSDFQGYFTGLGTRSLARFVSDNGIDWHPAKEPCFSPLAYPTPDGMKTVRRLERPQIFFEDGKALCFVAACAEDKDMERVYNVRIPFVDENTFV
ncbi:MAG: glycoside hydrolase family protein [Clostridia bacterium]|nr:glycoside hydrolase family protein [Clostridia bacterium]